MTREEIEGQPEYIMLNSLLIAGFQLDCQERLAGTTYYRQDIKHASNLLIKALYKYIEKDLPAIYGRRSKDDKDMYRLGGYIKEVIHELSSMKAEYIGVIHEVICKFKEKPQAVIDAFDIHIVDEIPEEA